MTLSLNMSNELRSMVREVLRDAMASRSQPTLSAVEAVHISTDAELAAFVARIIEPATLERIKAGKQRFTLGETASIRAASEAMTGVITEQKLARLGSGTTLILAPGAVLTPLARDRARRLGLKIERRN